MDQKLRQSVVSLWNISALEPMYRARSPSRSILSRDIKLQNPCCGSCAVSFRVLRSLPWPPPIVAICKRDHLPLLSMRTFLTVAAWMFPWCFVCDQGSSACDLVVVHVMRLCKAVLSSWSINPDPPHQCGFRLCFLPRALSLGPSLLPLIYVGKTIAAFDFERLRFSTRRDFFGTANELVGVWTSADRPIWSGNGS